MDNNQSMFFVGAHREDAIDFLILDKNRNISDHS